jgi:hypothetical protein
MYGTLYIYQSTPAIQSNVHEIGLYARYHYGIKANKRIGVDPYLAVFLRFKPDKSNIFYPYLALSPWIKIVEKLEIRSILGLGYGYSYKDKNFTFVIPFRFSVGFNYSI